MTPFPKVVRETASLALMIALLGGLSAGCNVSAGNYVGHREVIATAAAGPVTTTRLDSDDAAYFTIGRRMVKVTQASVSSSPRHTVALPDDWKTVQLMSVGAGIEVKADGRIIGRLEPDT